MPHLFFCVRKTVEECADPVRTIGNVEKNVSEKIRSRIYTKQGKEFIMLLNSSTLWWKVVIELFMGEYDHSIDKKGRIIIPVKYREELGASVIVCRGFDGCLNVYSEERWAVVCEKLATLPTTRANARKFVRSILAKAQRCEFDAQGRILVPAPLVKLAELQKACKVVGVGQHVEIWSKERYEAMEDEQDEHFEEGAETLMELTL